MLSIIMTLVACLSASNTQPQKPFGLSTNVTSFGSSSKLILKYDSANERIVEFSFDKTSGDQPENSFWESQAISGRDVSLHDEESPSNEIDFSQNASYSCDVPSFFEKSVSGSVTTKDWAGASPSEVAAANKTYEAFSLYFSYFSVLFGTNAFPNFFDANVNPLSNFNFSFGNGTNYFSWNGSPFLTNGSNRIANFIGLSAQQIYGWDCFDSSNTGIAASLKYLIFGVGPFDSSPLNYSYCDANIAPSSYPPNVVFFGDYDPMISANYIHDQVQGHGLPVLTMLVPATGLDAARFGIISGILILNQCFYCVFTDVANHVTSSILLRDSSGFYGDYRPVCISFGYDILSFIIDSPSVYFQRDSNTAFSIWGDSTATTCSAPTANGHTRTVNGYSFEENHHFVPPLSLTSAHCDLCGATIYSNGLIDNPDLN